MKFLFDGENGGPSPFLLNFLDPTLEKGDPTRGFHETEGHIVHEE